MLGLLKRDKLPQAMAVFTAAFSPSKFESRLLQCACQHANNAHCYVWELERQLVAAILYTRGYRGEVEIGYHLAPVAVHPDFQGRGIGSQLIRLTLFHTPVAKTPVFVLGNPGFYERFGFQLVRNAQCPYDPGNTHFRALRWDDQFAPFTIGYDKAFNEAESD